MTKEELIQSLKTALDLQLGFNLQSLQVICLACHSQTQSEIFDSSRLKHYSNKLYTKITKYYRNQSFAAKSNQFSHKPQIITRLLEFYDSPTLHRNLTSCIKIITESITHQPESAQYCPKCLILAAIISLRGEQAEIIAGRNWRILAEIGIDGPQKISESSFINDNAGSEGSNYSDLRNFVV